jgi:hypothetical protein
MSRSKQAYIIGWKRAKVKNWQKCYTFSMASPLTITFEVRNHRESLEGATAAGQLYASLPASPTGIFNVFSKAPGITIEFFNQGQTIYTFLTVPKHLEHYVHAQLTSSYPEALITPLAHNPLDEFLKPLPKAVFPVRLSHPSYLPLQTVMANPTADTLSALFSTLS